MLVLLNYENYASTIYQSLGFTVFPDCGDVSEANGLARTG